MILCPDCGGDMRSMAAYAALTDRIHYGAECPKCGAFFSGALKRDMALSIAEIKKQQTRILRLFNCPECFVGLDFTYGGLFTKGAETHILGGCLRCKKRYTFKLNMFERITTATKLGEKPVKMKL